MARREQFHQTVLVSNLNDYSNVTQSYLHGVQEYLSTVVQAGHGALAALHLQVQAQIALLSDLDVLKLFALLFVLLIPLLLSTGHISDADPAMTPH